MGGDSVKALAAKYLGWRRGRAVGCVFARLVATQPAAYDQVLERVSSGGPPDEVAGMIAECVDRLVADDGVSAGVLLLPELKTLEGLLAVSLALGKRPHWAVKTAALPPPPAGDLVAIHIARLLPFGETWCPSEVLVLGPFDGFPATRRAPVTAMEVFVGPPLPFDPKSHLPTTKANVAHMKLPDAITAKMIDKMWEKSGLDRELSLGTKDDNRAKAKVSFVVPGDLARQMGCAP